MQWSNFWSSFQNTDLDFQLRQRDITNVVIAGLTANACVEATARYAYEL
jgi:nicotinamidase-related amidase